MRAKALALAPFIALGLAITAPPLISQRSVSIPPTQLAVQTRTPHDRASRQIQLTTNAFDIDRAKKELERLSRKRIAIEAQRAALLKAANQPADREVILACIRAHEGGGYTTVSASGKYRGAYQMDASFWASYGDGSALTADQASPQSQDDAAWRGYQARGYGPWPPSQNGRCP